MDLSFWRYQKDAPRDHGRVYELACCDGQVLEQLEQLPVPQIRQKIAEAFGDWTRLGADSYEKEGKGAFEIFTTSQIVRFNCYGMGEADLNLLIDVLAQFGCPLYDPQISTRFDGWTDQ